MQPAYLTRPQSSEYAPPFGKYIALVPPGDPLAFLAAQLADLEALFDGMPESLALTIHAPYAWTLKQVLGHITDTERIFGARALRIARHDATPLASFDEMLYMAAADFNAVPIAELLEEYGHLRQSQILMFRHLPAAAWGHVGVVNNHPATARAFLYAIAGHTRHHQQILHRRLAKPLSA